MARYATVGGSAALVYYLSAIALVELGGLEPLAANPLAFLAAFAANYSGQRAWTFSDSTRPHRSSLPRFLVVAVVSFSLNQTLFYLLLTHTPLPYQMSLPIAAGSVALLSFMLALLWAFRSDRATGTHGSAIAATLLPRPASVQNQAALSSRRPA
jgi:putative flippase GtrA